MKILSIFLGVFCVTAVTGSPTLAAENFSSGELSSEGVLPADNYLRLSSLHCENCALIVRDLIEVGAVGNTIDAVRQALSGDLNYTFRLELLTACDHCYRAVHFWEMNMLNRPAVNEEIIHWLASDEYRTLAEYFKKY